MSPTTSLTLLDRLRNPQNVGDWELFISLYGPLIDRQLKQYSIDEHDCEDLRQETLSALFRSLKEFEHNGRPGAFRTWLRRIIHQRALYHLRTRSHSPVYLSPLGSGQFSDMAQAEVEEDAKWAREHDDYVLHRLMQIIEPEFTRSTWLAFLYQSVQGRAAKDVADDLKLSTNAVLIAKSRVLKRLRDLCTGIVDDRF
ncbi:MAG: sigma-70 family RNA polymerase sigma factor [Pirellulales bacterium]